MLVAIVSNTAIRKQNKTKKTTKHHKETEGILTPKIWINSSMDS